ncbi:hypothetical protein BABINDRAFT_38202 [Babjeviella inositovora NRRL Y-12698]|uniref:DUF3533 domain-containing protein n=1 Tax=Babjeviella inositovora NRRL Y-12698 TaxID=984486 RepID=A0A1E3QNJ1_9ASCO|nr:uncharacterized protein BABINDRAFT_38202 [Babjeviella inositovora NRRL Y-12698]ODQ79279.1 hypothetical protein BABINDRAFT_38202 [Babjeviella inositovora NRRL Y-12698]
MTSSSLTVSEDGEKERKPDDINDLVDREELQLEENIAGSVPMRPVPRKVGLFHPSMVRTWKNVVLGALKNYAIMVPSLILVSSLIFGTHYDTNSKLGNLNVVMVYDTDDGGLGLLSQALLNSTSNPLASDVAGWNTYTSTELLREYPDLTSADEAAQRLVHQRKAWAAIVVAPNATSLLKQALLSNDGSFNSTNLIRAYIETSSDPQVVGGYIIPGIMLLQDAFSVVLPVVYRGIFSTMNATERAIVFDGDNSFDIVTMPIFFALQDNLPFLNTVVVAPLTLGMVILIIVSFFLIGFFAPYHQQVAPKLLPMHFIVYRLIIGQVSFLVLSFTFTCVCACFRVDFNVRYGQGGFMFSFLAFYLAMSAVGLMNEVMFNIFFVTFPPGIGFWLLFWVLSNVGPTFSPIELCPEFYRYGYAMPIRNVRECLRVILCGCWDGHLAKNFGILAAWVVFGMLMIPPSMMFAQSRMVKKAKAEAAK